MPLIGMLTDEGEAIRFKDIPNDVLPFELRKSLIGKPRSTGVHLTDLTVCPISKAKDKKFNYFAPFKNCYRIVYGQAMDYLCDKNRRSNAIYQRTFGRFINGVEVRGTPDVIDLNRLSIEDFKRPERQYKEVPDSYVIQLNGYHWLSAVDLYPIKINVLTLNAIGPTYYREFDVPVWGLDRTYDYLQLRLDRFLQMMERITDPNEPLCTDPTCIFCKGKVLYET